MAVPENQVMKIRIGTTSAAEPKRLQAEFWKWGPEISETSSLKNKMKVRQKKKQKNR